jgi:hypothetical protein
MLGNPAIRREKKTNYFAIKKSHTQKEELFRAK